MNQWFTCTEERILGPYTAEELKNEIKMGHMEPTTLVWGPLMSEWKSVSWWEMELTQLMRVRKLSHDPRPWYYAVDGQYHGPFPRQKFITEIKKLDTKSDILVWTKGMNAWISIFEFSDILEEADISRRQHPRTPIKGSVVVKTVDKTILGKISIISEGGCGILGVDGLKNGEKISVDIKSAVFADVIRVRAEVRYITEGGFVGLKFDPMADELQEQINQYVKNQISAPAAKAA